MENPNFEFLIDRYPIYHMFCKKMDYFIICNFLKDFSPILESITFKRLY